jgi:hypothetical protein
MTTHLSRTVLTCIRIVHDNGYICAKCKNRSGQQKNLDVFSKKSGTTVSISDKIHFSKQPKQMSKTLEQRKKFVKDGLYPIPVVQSPYFEYFLDLYEDVYQTKTKWNQIMNNEIGYQEFFRQANLLTKKIIRAVESTEEFKQFKASGDSIIPKNKNTNLSKKLIYSPEFVGKILVSVDIKCANFTSLKFSNPKIVFGCETYKQLVESVARETFDPQEISGSQHFPKTDFNSQVVAYVSENKGLRQVVFGMLDPKKQQIIQRHMISLVTDCLTTGGINQQSIVRCTSDEVIFQLGSSDCVDSWYQKTKQIVVDGLPQLTNDLKIEIFTLQKIENEKNGEVVGYRKQFLCNSSTKGLESELKSVQKHLFAQVYKKSIGCPVVDNDLVFTHEGMVAQFKNSFFDVGVE